MSTSLTRIPPLPSNLPSISKAKLPAMYESAKGALAECSRIDECKDWADKAEALASYAKQAGDDSLRTTADRIQARAIRRCGELLKEIKPAKNQHDAKERAYTGSGTSRSEAAKEAGLSARQKNTALRVASVPRDDFEKAIESDRPATVTELAERGKKPAPLSDLKGRDPQDFKACTAALGFIRDLYSFALHTDPNSVARGASEKERERLVSQLQPLLDWFSDLLGAIERESK